MGSDPRDTETIDGDLRIVAWRLSREISGSSPSTTLIDQLLDERTTACRTAMSVETVVDDHLGR